MHVQVGFIAFVNFACLDTRDLMFWSIFPLKNSDLFSSME